MATNITLTYCGMPGEGPTVAKARANAAEKITAVLRDVETGPRLVCVANHTALVWRDLHGFAYRLLTGLGAIEAGRVFGVSGNDTEREAVRRAVLHMAQIAWTHDVPDDAEFTRCVDGQLSSRETEAHMKTWLVDYFNWQRRYRLAHDAGLPDGECHDFAGRTTSLEDARAKLAARTKVGA